MSYRHDYYTEDIYSNSARHDPKGIVCDYDPEYLTLVIRTDYEDPEYPSIC